MEIRVKVPNGTLMTRQTLDIDKEAFIEDLTTFIDLRENKNEFSEDLYNKLLSYGINKFEFDKMIERLETYASYDDPDKESIDFPYENWISKLLVYFK